MTKEDLKALAEFTVACVKPQRPHYAVEVAKDYLRLLAQEEAREQAALEGPWPCHECGHEHTERRFAYICIGCPCQLKPEKGA